MNHPRVWFRPKTLGIGWTPATWEGWAITAGISAAVIYYASSNR